MKFLRMNCLNGKRLKPENKEFDYSQYQISFIYFDFEQNSFSFRTNQSYHT